jgi:hypothetical protein
MKVPSIAPNSARYLTIRGEVHARLHPMCMEMSSDLFREMVQRIALVQLTFEGDPLLAALLGAR